MTRPSASEVGSGSQAGLGTRAGDISLGELIGEVTKDLTTLMRQELSLARAEVKQEATKSGRAAGLLGVAGFAGYMVLLFLSIALAVALAHVMDGTWASLIVAAVWAAVSGFLYFTGRRRLRAVHPKPEQTVETLKEVPGALRGREERT